MRELRTCPVTGAVVLLNDEWLDAPMRRVPPPDPCPGCLLVGEGIDRVGETRAFPASPPAVGVEGRNDIRAQGSRLARDAVGAHELLVGTHAGDDAEAIHLAQRRVLDLRGDRRLRGFHLGRRFTPGHHAVWQLFALPFEGPLASPERWRQEELAAGVRIVGAEPEAVAILAWAPRAPFEVWVVGREGTEGMGVASAAMVRSVARLVVRLRSRIVEALPGCEIDQVVVDGEPWRVELVPRVRRPGLFPDMTGIPVHGTFPEAAAAWLRREAP